MTIGTNKEPSDNEPPECKDSSAENAESDLTRGRMIVLGIICGLTYSCVFWMVPPLLYELFRNTPFINLCFISDGIEGIVVIMLWLMRSRKYSLFMTSWFIIVILILALVILIDATLGGFMEYTHNGQIVRGEALEWLPVSR